MGKLTKEQAMDILSKVRFEELTDLEQVLESVGFDKQIFHGDGECLIRYSSGKLKLDCFAVLDCERLHYKIYPIPME